MSKNPSQSQEDESAEQAFYLELDKKTRRKSCCSFPTMAIFFAVLLVVSIVITILVFRKIQNSDFSFQKIYPSLISQNSFKDKLSLDPAVNPEMEIIVTPDELTSISSKGISSGIFQIKDIQFIIEDSGIDIFGTSSRPLKANLQIQTTPQVQDGKIALKVNKVVAGDLTLPGFLVTPLEKPINELMDENFQPLYENYQVETIELAQDEMRIRGKLK